VFFLSFAVIRDFRVLSSTLVAVEDVVAFGAAEAPRADPARETTPTRANVTALLIGCICFLHPQITPDR